MALTPTVPQLREELQHAIIQLSTYSNTTEERQQAKFHLQQCGSYEVVGKCLSVFMCVVLCTACGGRVEMRGHGLWSVILCVVGG